jgi:hypothetical protein
MNDVRFVYVPVRMNHDIAFSVLIALKFEDFEDDANMTHFFVVPALSRFNLNHARKRRSSHLSFPNDSSIDRVYLTH